MSDIIHGGSPSPVPPNEPDVEVGNDEENIEVASGEHVVSVAPGNTHADEPYLGTDPVYQNHANDTEAPLTVDLDDDADEATTMGAYVEEVATKNFEEAQEAGQNLGISGFTVPAQPQPPRTVEEIRDYEEDKAKRLAAARREAEKNPATRP